MKLKSMVMENFCSFSGKHEIHFPDNLIIYGDNQDMREPNGRVLADSNGAGKTSVLNAISWALYGDTPSGVNKDRVIHNRADTASVKLELCGLQIFRFKKRSKAESLVWKDAHGEHSGSLADVQQKLNDLLKIDFQTFCNSVYLHRASKAANFLFATPQKRVEILGSLIDDTIYVKAAQIAKADIASTQERIRTAQMQTTLWKQQLERLEEEKRAAEIGLKDFRESETARRESVMREIDQIDAQIEELSKVFLETSPMSMRNLEAKRVKLLKSIAVLEAEAGKKPTEVWQGAAGEVCPTCYRPLEDEDAVYLKETEEEIANYRKATLEKAQQLKATLRNVEAAIQKIRDLDISQDKAKLKIQSLNVEKTFLRDKLQEQNGGILVARLKDVQGRLADTRNLMEEATNKTKLAKNRVEHVKKVERMLSRDLRNMLFDRARAGLEHFTRVYLGQLAGDEFEVTFPYTNKAGTEKFEILVRHGIYDQDLSAYSEGETWRIGFAVLMALRRILLTTNKAPFQFMLLDDPLGALDSSGLEVFLELLPEIEGQKILTLPKEVESQWPLMTVRKSKNESSLVSR